LGAAGEALPTRERHAFQPTVGTPAPAFKADRGQARSPPSRDCSPNIDKDYLIQKNIQLD
jgi:hypothetical protein